MNLDNKKLKELKYEKERDADSRIKLQDKFYDNHKSFKPNKRDIEKNTNEKTLEFCDANLQQMLNESQISENTVKNR